MGVFSFTTSRFVVGIALTLVCTLSTMLIFHAITPHHHPDESSHHEDGDTHDASTLILAHGHEDRFFFTLVVAMLLVVAVCVALLQERAVRLVLAHARNDFARRIPPLLVRLFSEGILHPRLS